MEKEIKVEEVEMSVRLRNCLKNKDIKTLNELSAYTDRDLFKTRSFGRKSFNELQSILVWYGFPPTHTFVETPKPVVVTQLKTVDPLHFTHPKKAVNYCFSKLPINIGTVIYLRYVKKNTVRQVMEVMDVSRARVDQIEKHGIRLLRHPSCSKYLRPWIEDHNRAYEYLRLIDKVFEVAN